MVTRREFVTVGTAGLYTLLWQHAVGATVDAVVRQSAGPATDPACSTLARTALRFEDFVLNSMIDRDGLCRSFLCADTLKPWTEEQLSDTDLSFFFQNLPHKAACLTYENSLMSTGEFAVSQMERFRVTREASAERRARRAVRAILAVADEGRHYAPGYLPKPFGGLQRAQYSHAISPDQYTKSIVALDAWRRVTDDAAEMKRVETFIVQAADFFVARRFRHAYRDRTIVTAQTHNHALGLFVPLVVLATNITGRASYRSELKEFDQAIDMALQNPALSNFNMASLLIDGFDLAIREGGDDLRLKELIKTVWLRALAFVDDDGIGYEEDDRRKRTSQVARMAAAGPLVKRHWPTIETEAVAKKVLLQLSDIQKMRHYAPADIAVLSPSHRWLAQSIDDTGVTSWLIGYWRSTCH